MLNWSLVRRLLSCVLAALMSLPADASSQSHVVKLTDLQKEVMEVTNARQRNVETVTSFLNIPEAQKALNAAGLNPVQLHSALSSMTDQYLARLAPRAETARADFAAGRIPDRDLIWIVLIVVGIVLIVVILRR